MTEESETFVNGTAQADAWWESGYRTPPEVDGEETEDDTRGEVRMLLGRRSVTHSY